MSPFHFGVLVGVLLGATAMLFLLGLWALLLDEGGAGGLEHAGLLNGLRAVAPLAENNRAGRGGCLSPKHSRPRRGPGGGS